MVWGMGPFMLDPTGPEMHWEVSQSAGHFLKKGILKFGPGTSREMGFLSSSLQHFTMY